VEQAISDHEINNLPAAMEPSTSDTNVERARKRRDALSPQVISAAHDLVLRSLGKQSREPFRRLLAEVIGASPTPEALRRFADKHPDRWAQALSILGGLAGFDRGVMELNVFNFGSMSDSQLMSRMAELDSEISRLRARPTTTGEVVDAVVVSDSAGKASAASRPALESASAGTPNPTPPAGEAE
jgi:hypothetical protein